MQLICLLHQNSIKGKKGKKTLGEMNGKEPLILCKFQQLNLDFPLTLQFTSNKMQTRDFMHRSSLICPRHWQGLPDPILFRGMHLGGEGVIGSVESLRSFFSTSQAQDETEEGEGL